MKFQVHAYKILEINNELEDKMTVSDMRNNFCQINCAIMEWLVSTGACVEDGQGTFEHRTCYVRIHKAF